jgi:hypothetical protein
MCVYTHDTKSCLSADFDPLVGEVLPEKDEYPNPTVKDALAVANETKHIFKDPRSGPRHDWTNNYMGQTTPMKNWNPLGEDVVRYDAVTCVVASTFALAMSTCMCTQAVSFQQITELDSFVRMHTHTQYSFFLIMTMI